MVHDERFSSTPAAVEKSFTATLFERNTMLKTLKRKIALVAVAGLGFGLVSTVPAFAAQTAGTDLTVSLIAAPTTTGGLTITEGVGSVAGKRIYNIFTTQTAINLSDLSVTVTGTFGTIASDPAPLTLLSGVLADTDVDAKYNTFSLNPAASGRTGSDGVAGATLTGVIGTTTEVGGGGGQSLASTTTAGASAAGTLLNIYNDIATVGTFAAATEKRAIIRVYQVQTARDATFASAGNVTGVRTDDTAFDSVPGGAAGDVELTATAGGANDFVGATVSVTWKATPTSTAVKISTVDNDTVNATVSSLGTAVDLNFTNTTSGSRSLGKAVNGVYTIANTSNAAGDGDVVTGGGNAVIKLRLGRNAVPGIYTLNVDTTKANVADTVNSISVTIADAPTAIALDGNTSATSAEEIIGTGGNATFNFYATDAAGRSSYFLGTEKATMAVSGGAVAGKVSITNPVIPTIGSGALSATAASQQVPVTVAVAALAAGTYTITTTASGFATAASTPATTTSTLKVISDALVSTAATKFTNATAGVSGSATVVSTAVFDDAAAGAGASVVGTFLPVDQTKITLTATFPSTTTGDAKVTVASSTIPGITAATTVINPISAGTATFEFQATGTAATQTARFQLTSTAGNVFEIDVTYAAAVVGKLTMTPIANGNSALVAPASTNDLTATVVDQFGRALPGVNVVFTVQAGSRGAVSTNKSYSYTSNASGVAVLSLADAYTGTALTTNTVVISVGGAVTNQTVTLVYGTSVASTVSLAVAQPTNPGTTATYATDVTLATAPSVTVDTSLGATNNNTDQLKIADQVAVVATVKDANGVVIRGQKVAISADAGVFLASATVATVTAITAADVDLAAATRKSTLELYSDADGKVAFTAAFTKSGTAVKLTATAGSATKSWSTKVVAGANAVVATKVSGSAVTTTVTDVWGNPVAGAAVSLSVTGGLRFSNGFSSTSGNTAADGTLTTEVQGSGTGTVTATITAGDSAALASTTYGTAAGVATVDASVTGAAINAATETAISAVKTDVKAVSDTVATLAKAVTTVQSSVTELTTSFASQIQSLTAAIAKISKAIAAIQKSLKKK